MLFVSCFGAQAQDETCPEGTVQYIVAITVDYYGSETGFYINENPDMIQYDGVNDPISNLGPIVYSIPAGTYPNLIQGQTFFEEVCLTNGCYSFSIYDTWGDGMGFTNGSYQLLVGDSVVLFGGGNFGAWDSQVFCVDSAIEILPVLGCTDSSACNYYPGATEDDGSCLFPGSPCAHENPLITNAVFNENCFCEGSIIYGCTDSLAMNYNPEAAVSDGQCYYTPGCTEILACNYNPLADFDDGSCEFLSCLVVGCMDIYANNYNPEANTPNLNFCMYHEPSFVIVQNCKQIMIINTTPETLIEGPGVWFNWSFGDDSPSFMSSQDTIIHAYGNGTYTISLDYAQGYSLQSTSLVVDVNDFESIPIISFENEMIVCDQFADLYSWYCNGNLILETEENYLTLDSSIEGYYMCSLFRDGGCTATSNELMVTSVKEESLISTVQVYPTCITDFFTIDNYTGFVSVFDSFGKQVLSQYVYEKTLVEFSSFASGMYFVQTGAETKKILKR